MNRAIIHPFPPPLQMAKFTPYILVDNFFNLNQCSKIKGLMRGGFRAQIEGDGNAREDLSIRGTTVFGIEPSTNTMWIFEMLHDFVVRANFDLWGFDLSGFCEGIQISRYNVGDHYDWHMDIGGGVLSQRKLSIVVQLTEPTEYEGGELEFFRNGDAPKQIGTMILFPSYMHHRVRAITKGQRHSLVCWVSGNPYK
jgi:PKHD-type hydroxylase